jgi:hypothetical protein
MNDDDITVDNAEAVLAKMENQYSGNPKTSIEEEYNKMSNELDEKEAAAEEAKSARAKTAIAIPNAKTAKEKYLKLSQITNKDVKKKIKKKRKSRVGIFWGQSEYFFNRLNDLFVLDYVGKNIRVGHSKYIDDLNKNDWDKKGYFNPDLQKEIIKELEKKGNINDLVKINNEICDTDNKGFIQSRFYKKLKLINERLIDIVNEVNKNNNITAHNAAVDFDNFFEKNIKFFNKYDIINDKEAAKRLAEENRVKSQAAFQKKMGDKKEEEKKKKEERDKKEANRQAILKTEQIAAGELYKTQLKEAAEKTKINNAEFTAVIKGNTGRTALPPLRTGIQPNPPTELPSLKHKPTGNSKSSSRQVMPIGGGKKHRRTRKIVKRKTRRIKKYAKNKTIHHRRR